MARGVRHGAIGGMKRVMTYLVLILGCIAFSYPLLYAVGVGFMSKNQFQSDPPALIPIAKPAVLFNYRILLLMDSEAAKYSRYYLNSLLRTVWYVVIVVLSSFVGGYVFSRLRFRGKKLVFGCLMASAMLPGVITMAPSYLLMARFPLAGGNNILGWGGTGFIDTYTALLALGLVNILGIFLVRMSLETFPKALEESAYIDGAGIVRVMFQVVFPIQVPILAYLAITTGIGIWNDWYLPFIYTNSAKYATLASAIVKMASGEEAGLAGVPDWPRLITAGLGLTIPSLGIFAAFQRYIVEGLASAAVKG